MALYRDGRENYREIGDTMNARSNDILTWRGRVDRRTYLLLGTLLFLVKFLIDWLVATRAFGRDWTPFNYLKPTDVMGGILSLDPAEQRFYWTMAIVAVPFIWVGVGLTVQRLRDAGASLWLVLLFFAPMPINLITFVVVGCLPTKIKLELEDPEFITAELDPEFAPPIRLGKEVQRPYPAVRRGSFFQQLYSLSIVLPVSLGLVFFSVRGLGQYGWGVFLGMPFAGPMVTVILYGIPERRTFGQCMSITLLWMLLMFLALLLVAFEGLICLLMMMPIMLPIAFMGGAVGYVIQSIPSRQRDIAAMCIAVAVLLPSLMGAEVLLCPPAPLFRADTSIEIDAPPETVWKNVVSFSELPPPDDWLFRTGIAYPIRAEIDGRGPGAIRHCIFSTGPFVEPIEVWDEPRLLRFSVTQCPEPMRELNPFFEIHPPHLQNFLLARHGEFRLVRLPGGRTRLEGTTWYQHHMWPAGYWQAWSSPIIQRIHMQVLKHVKRLSEQD